jgi:ABC-2 type transport system permease protein
MRAFSAMVRVGLRQVMNRKRLIGLSLLGLLPAVVAWFATADSLTDADVRSQYHDAPMAMLFLIVVPVVALMLGSGALGDERRDGTLSFLTLRPNPRWSITTAKLVAAAIATAVASAGAATVTAAVVGIRAGDWSLVWPTVLGASVTALAYVSVFLVLGYLTSRAVLIGLAYLFIWESGVTFAAPSLANVSLFRIGVSAYAGIVPDSRSTLDEIIGVLAPGAGGAALKSVGIAAVCVTVTAFLLKRTDQL